MNNSILFFIIVYICQILIIFVWNYFTLKKGATLYDFLSFNMFDKYSPIPGCILVTPLIGTIALFCMLIALGLIIGSDLLDQIKHFLRKTLTLKIK